MEAMAATIGSSTGSVNGYLTGRSGEAARSFYRSMLKDTLARIEQRLEALDISATAASKDAGLSEDAIRNMRRAVEAGNRKGVSTKTIAGLAKALKTTEAWLLSGQDTDAADDGQAVSKRSATVPVVGYVQAGAEAVLFADGQGPFDFVPAPEGSTEKTVAVQVRGESLGPFFSEWLVFYDDVRSPITSDLLNELCVVGLPDGRILVKKVQPSRTPNLFHLLSQTEGPLLDQEIEWAAKVKTMSPR